ncbi:MAG: PAS domain S-box protein [Thainema sp.]
MPTMLGQILQPIPLQFEPDQPITDIVAAMTEQAASLAVVLDQQALVGIVTPSNVLQAIAQGSAIAPITVAEIMTAPVPTITLQTSLLEADQVLRQHQLHHLVVTDAAGRVVGMVTEADILRTLLTQQQFTKRLTRSKIEHNLFCQICSQVNIGIAVVGLDWKLRHTNTYLQNLLGYSAAELSQLDYIDIIHPADRPDPQLSPIDCITTLHHQVSFEKRYLHKDGQEIWAQLTIAPIRDQQGQCSALVAVIEDIRQRKAAEARVQFQSYLLEAVDDAVVATDPAGQITYWNQGAQKLYGWSLEQVKGRWIVDVLCHDAEQIEALKLLDCLKQGESWRGEFDVQHQDGTILPVLSTNSPIYNEQKELIGIVGVAKDLRDRKQIELDLQQAKISAEEANQAKSQFLSSMSHELRTPLNSILGFAQVLSWDATLASKQAKYINIISQSGQHLLQLINSVLEMSRIEAGRLTVENTKVDLGQMITTLQDLFQLKAKRKHLDFRIETIEPVPQSITTDEGKLRQILINLLGNAFKFTQQGQVTLRLFSNAACNSADRDSIAQAPAATGNQSHWVYFEVMDTGLGIAQAELDQLFQTFSQTTTGKQAHEGAGLGLAISQSYAKLMGGIITVKSQVNIGSQFTLSLPVVPNPTPDSATVSAPSLPTVDPSPAPAPTPISPLFNPSHQLCDRILIVEDQLENRLVLTQLLEPLNCQIEQATNGQEAIDLVQKWQPDLVLMDIQLPIMDGYEATRRIKSMPQGQNIPIIAVTSHAFKFEHQKILAAGCDGCITKPVEANVLFETIAKYLKPRQQTDQSASWL